MENLLFLGVPILKHIRVLEIRTPWQIPIFLVLRVQKIQLLMFKVNDCLWMYHQ